MGPITSSPPPASPSNDGGTLWTEKPLVIQLDFTIRRFRELAEDDPALRAQQPYQAAYEVTCTA